MKKAFYPASWTLLVFAGIILFVSCKKDIHHSSDPKASVMAFNLTIDRPSIGYLISNTYLTDEPLAYLNSTVYLPVFSGSAKVKLFDATTDTILSNTSFTFGEKKYYSIFAVGARHHYKNIIVNDSFPSLHDSSGKAYVRFVNAIPDSSTATISALSPADSVLLSIFSSYTSVSAYKEITPGSVTFKLDAKGFFSIKSAFAIEENKSYTLLLTGMYGEKDPAKSVRIRCLLNGAVVPEIPGSL